MNQTSVPIFPRPRARCYGKSSICPIPQTPESLTRFGCRAYTGEDYLWKAGTEYQREDAEEFSVADQRRNPVGSAVQQKPASIQQMIATRKGPLSMNRNFEFYQLRLV